MARNTFFAFSAQIATALATAALTLVLLRLLGSAAYGEFALALAIGSLVLLPADLGLSGATARFLAESRGDRAATQAFVVNGFRLKLAISLLAAGALFALAGPIASAYGQPELVWPLRGMALAVLGAGVMRLCVVCFSARERNSLSLLVVSGESLAELAASVALVALAGGAAAASFGRAIGYGFGTLLGIVVLLRVFDVSPLRLFFGRSDRRIMRRIAGYGGGMAIADGVWAIFSQVDILLIAAILTAGAVTAFQAPMRMLVLVSYPGLALGASVGPRLARRTGGARPDATPLVAAVRALLICQTLAAAFAIGWAEPLTRIVFGEDNRQSAEVLAALSPYVLLSGLAPLLSNAITYVGGTRPRIRVAVAALVVNVVLDILLLPRIGVVGAAIGTDVGYAVYVGGHLLIGARLIGFPLDRIMATLVRCGFALPLAVALLLAGARIGVLAAVPLAVAACLVFLATLMALGESTARGWLRAARRLRRPLTHPRLLAQRAVRGS